MKIHIDSFDINGITSIVEQHLLANKDQLCNAVNTGNAYSEAYAIVSIILDELDIKFDN